MAHRSAAERTSGLRSVLSVAPVYRAAQRLIGADSLRTELAEKILRVTQFDRMIDIGCGTADILEHLPPLDYLGFDPNRRYVDDAVARFGSRGTFVTSAAEHFTKWGSDRTIATAIGVLHHMDDETAHAALDLASGALERRGRFVSIDPTLVDGQHQIARLLVSRDRGRHVRTPEETKRLVSAHFDEPDVRVRHDLLRVPYSHVIVEAVVRP